MIFILLVPFNATLLITKTMPWFNIVTKFRPLIDGHTNVSIFTGQLRTQLLVRVAFAVSSLDRNLNLTIGMLLLSLITRSCRSL